MKPNFKIVIEIEYDDASELAKTLDEIVEQIDETEGVDFEPQDGGFEGETFDSDGEVNGKFTVKEQ